MRQYSKDYYAVVLAAGFGTRMKPLTDHIPKPLIEFMGIPSIMVSLAMLKNIGLTDIGINAHHNAQLIQEFADTNPFQQNLFVSVEKDKILGSGGSFPPFNQQRGKRQIIALNGDVISDLDLIHFIEEHESKNALASMALLPVLNPKGNSVWINSSNQIVAICPEKPANAVAGGTFTGIQILSDEFVNQIPNGVESNILDFYRNNISVGKKVYAYFQNCFWHDIGNPQDYIKAHKAFQKSKPNIGLDLCLKSLNIDSIHFHEVETHLKNNIRIFPPCVIIGNPLIGENSIIGPNVLLSSKVRVGSKCHIEDCFLINEAQISNHTKIKNSIKSKFDEIIF